MCRGGRMFAPTKTFRKWTRKVNIKIRRLAVRAALSASAVPALVMARGHNIVDVPEIPLVVPDTVHSLRKTKDAVKLMKDVGLGADLLKVTRTRGIRPGGGKRRTRRYRTRKGPILVVSKPCKAKLAFRNILGVDVMHIRYLNLLKLAPGGHIGRMIVWSESSFKLLNKIFGGKPEAVVDSRRVLNSEEVQGCLRKKRPQARKCRKNLPKPRLNPARSMNVKAARLAHRHARLVNRTQKHSKAKAAKQAKKRWIEKQKGKIDKHGKPIDKEALKKKAIANAGCKSKKRVEKALAKVARSAERAKQLAKGKADKKARLSQAKPKAAAPAKASASPKQAPAKAPASPKAAPKVAKK